MWTTFAVAAATFSFKAFHGNPFTCLDTIGLAGEYLYFGTHFLKKLHHVAKREKLTHRAPKRIPKARYLRRSPLTRRDVTRGEYNAIIDILNERKIILDAIRETLVQLEQASETQFKRIAQIQADLDVIKRAWARSESLT